MFLDLWLRTGADFEACLTEPTVSTFTGCRSDGACAKRIIPSLVETFSTVNLNLDFDIAENPAAEDAERLYSSHCTSARVGLTSMARKTFKGLPDVQSFPPHVKQLIS